MRKSESGCGRSIEENSRTFESNLGVGVDIIDVERFHNLSLKDNKSLLEKIFTQKELDYCFSRKNSAQHLAARYSGKESVVKALNNLGLDNPPYNQIEIINAENGVPYVIIDSNKFKNLKINISLSHCEDKAIAFVVAIKVSQGSEIKL